MKLRYLIAGLVGILIMFGLAAPTAQAKGKPQAVTGVVVQVAAVTQDANQPVRYAVSAINAGAINITLQQVNSCAGALCIQVGIVDAHPAGTCGNEYGGCEYTWPGDPVCHVSITSNLKPLNKDLPKSVATHEILHCLGLQHRSYDEDPATIMGSTIAAQNPTMVPSAGDFAVLNEDWADGYQAPAA